MNQNATGNDQRGRGPRFGRLCRKELRESLRDRRTIITLVLMPLLVYPILSIIFQRFLLTQAPNPGAVDGIIIGVESDQESESLFKLLAIGHNVLLREAKVAGEELDMPELVIEELNQEAWRIQCIVMDDPIEALKKDRIDLVVQLRQDESERGKNSLPHAAICLQHDDRSQRSRRAERLIEKHLQAINRHHTQQMLERSGAVVDNPVSLMNIHIENDQPSTLSLASLIPLILILMTITGAVYPAIDLTAGERERGTLEALIAAPVPRFELLAAKYTAVITVALLTAAANLVAMSVTLYSAGIADAVFGPDVFSFRNMMLIFLLLVLFAGFFSGVLLCVTSFARSFKEAQAYLIPLMLISMAPGIVCLVPGIAFRGWWSVVPLVNIVLMARDIFEGTLFAGPAVAAIVSTTLYAVCALALAAKIFGADAVLYGTQASWSEWLERPSSQRSTATMSTALMCLVCIFPLYILMAGVLAQMSNRSIQVRLAVASVVTIVLFGVVPVSAALLGNIRLSTAFRIRPTSFVTCLAAGLLGVSLWPLVHELFLFQRSLGVTTLTETQIQSVSELVDQWHSLSHLYIILTMAIVPAVFEELFFRGFLLSALLERFTPRRSLICSAVLFGVFHVIVTSALAIERFLPSTCMGLVLGWICYRTGSVLPGMVLHAFHNGLLVTIGYYQQWLLANRLGEQEQFHLPLYWLCCAAFGTLLGIWVLRQVTIPTREPAVQP